MRADLGRPPVDIVVIGAMKAGTTWLDGMLRAATDADLPVQTKETFFFDRHHDRGPSWYSAMFPDRTDAPRIEVASTYYASLQAVDRLQAVSPNALVVAMVREPGARSWSHYRHAVRKGRVRPDTSFESAVRDEPDILELSRYHQLLGPWADAFGDRFVLLQFERLAMDPVGFATDVGATLGLEVRPADVPVGKTNVARRPRSHVLSRLAAQTSAFLHRHDLHRVVDGAKRLGVQRVVEGSTDESAVDRPSATAYARAAVADDTARLRAGLLAGSRSPHVDLDLWD